MEFINYTRHDTTSRTTIKNVKTNLILNSKREKDFSGIGSYMEVQVLKKGQNSIIKIPFFHTYKKNFINKDGINYINKNAKKVVQKVIKKNKPEFDLNAFVANRIAEINHRINNLGTTPLDQATKYDLERYRDNVLNDVKKNDSERLISDEINYLTSYINDGLKLSDCKNNTERVKKIKEYLNNFEYLETLKFQKKKLTWSSKKGIRKLNNKYVKGIGATLLAGLLGFGIYELANTENTNKNDSKNDSPKKVVTTVEPKPTLTKAPVVNEENQTDLKYDINGEAITSAYDFNLARFESNSELFNTRDYGYNYEQAVYGYTFVEHIDEIDHRNLNQNEIQEYFNAARVLINIAVEKNSYMQLPLEDNTYSVITNCLNGNYELGINFVGNAKENNVPLLDMLTVGEQMGYLLDGNTLYNFNTNVYYKEIEEYFNNLIKGYNKETVKVLKLNI